MISQVYIAQKDFDLAVKDSSIGFLCEMFNLVSLLDELADALDGTKKQNLLDIHKAASKMASLHSQVVQRPPPQSLLPPITEQNEPSGSREHTDSLGIFDLPEIRSALDQNDYEVSFTLFGVSPSTCHVLRLHTYYFIAPTHRCNCTTGRWFGGGIPEVCQGWIRRAQNLAIPCSI
jgi:hypothetical protein